MVIKIMKTYIKEILQNRKALNKADYVDFSEKICKKTEALKEYQEAENVLVFYPYLSEVDILPLVLRAHKAGKKVYFPKVTGETTMEFVLVNTLEEFSEGYKGIKEPNGTILFDKKAGFKNSCMLAPGSVFDRFGNRCGYGKGYYDRYLMDCYENITIIGICFSLQMLEKIPNVKPTDIPMDYVINEVETIRR